LVDVRVDHHEDPLGELARLVRVAEAYHQCDVAEEALVRGDVAAALEGAEAGLALLPGEENLLLSYVGALIGVGRVDEASAEVRRLVAEKPRHPVTLTPLAPQPEDVLWPADAWPEGEVPAGVELEPLLDRVFDDSGPLATTYAVLVVHRGRLVLERYQGRLEHLDRPAEPVTAETQMLSWSMAKSMLHAVVGLLVGEGRLDLDSPAAVPEWSDPADPRHAITLNHLLAMRDGLDFVEDYVDDRVSDVIKMLFGDGHADMAHFAADRPLAAPPGQRFNYSSGTSNIISAVVARAVGAGEPYRAFLRNRLFDPIGMRSAAPEFDAAGTWVASSYVRTTARDFAKFGLLYQRDGIWEWKRLLPEGWVDHGRTMRSDDPEDGPYGAQWWGVAGDTLGTFRASGYEGQSITICPALDLIVVRLGKTPAERYPHLVAWRADMVRAFQGA
jgi:CubicO group peptidase (beta-lactamase class C family)